MWTRARNWLVTAALVAAVALTWWLGRSGEDARDLGVTRRAVPQGYYLKDAVMRVTDQTGRVFYSIRAGRVERPEHEPRLDLEQVQIEYRADDDSSWQVNADYASTPNDYSFVDLRGDVRVVKRVTRARDGTSIRTDALRLVPDMYLARTDRRVSMTIGDNELSGTGFSADLKANKFDLESNVHGEFFP
jgi:LPS export ABC transporter protein LptC